MNLSILKGILVMDLQCFMAWYVTCKESILESACNVVPTISSSIGNQCLLCISSWHWLWYAARPLISRVSCSVKCWTCLESKSSIFTSTSDRSLANFARASWRQRKTNLKWYLYEHNYINNTLQNILVISVIHSY